MISVSDPYSFFPVEVEAGDQYGSGSNPDPGFKGPKIGKKLQLKKKLNFFLIKNCNLPLPRPP
jgi:hypothetical protein